MESDPLEQFRNNFFQKLEDERIKNKRIQKKCLHKYTKITPYNSQFSIASCEKCKHNKYVILIKN
jgi:hypothetical protein